MIAQPHESGLCWDQVTGLMPFPDRAQRSPQGILVPNSRTKRDAVAVVYNKGAPPPEITVKAISGSVTSVLADGVAVAVVAHAKGPDLTPEDVLLVEQSL